MGHGCLRRGLCSRDRGPAGVCVCPMASLAGLALSLFERAMDVTLLLMFRISPRDGPTKQQRKHEEFRETNQNDAPCPIPIMHAFGPQGSSSGEHSRSSARSARFVSVVFCKRSWSLISPGPLHSFGPSRVHPPSDLSAVKLCPRLSPTLPNDRTIVCQSPVGIGRQHILRPHTSTLKCSCLSLIQSRPADMTTRAPS